MRRLSDSEIRTVWKAIVGAGLTESRTALLANIDPAYVASLRHAESPADQLWSDLNAMNQSGTLLDRTVPLCQWLESAILLLGNRPQRLVCEQMLSRCREFGPELESQRGMHDHWIDEDENRIPIKPGALSILTVYHVDSFPSHMSSKIVNDPYFASIGFQLISDWDIAYPDAFHNPWCLGRYHRILALIDTAMPVNRWYPDVLERPSASGKLRVLELALTTPPMSLRLRTLLDRRWNQIKAGAITSQVRNSYYENVREAIVALCVSE